MPRPRDPVALRRGRAHVVAGVDAPWIANESPSPVPERRSRAADTADGRSDEQLRGSALKRHVARRRPGGARMLDHAATDARRRRHRARPLAPGPRRPAPARGRPIGPGRAPRSPPRRARARGRRHARGRLGRHGRGARAARPDRELRPRGRLLGGRDQRRRAGGRRRRRLRRRLPRPLRLTIVRQPRARPLGAAGDERRQRPRLRLARPRRRAPPARGGEPDRAALRRRRRGDGRRGRPVRPAHEAAAVGRGPGLQPDALGWRTSGDLPGPALRRRRAGRADPRRRGPRRRGHARPRPPDAPVRRAAQERTRGWPIASSSATCAGSTPRS